MHPAGLTAGREPALAWLREPASSSGSSGLPAFYAGPQAAWALETWLLGGEALAELEDRSAFGESIAARSLAAVHSVIVALAGGESKAPRDAESQKRVRSRLLASAASSPITRSAAANTRSAEDAVPSVIEAAVVAVGQTHGKRPDDAQRAATIARLGADRRNGDAELERLLERVQEWLDFPLLVVSVVHGGETVHRAYRTTLADPPRVVPREASYCTHCVAGDAPLVVEDARADAFFSRHPAVAAFGLVAYCGVPVRVGIGSADEAVVGTLCGYDVRARPVLVEDAATLEVFARRAAAIIEGRVDDPSWADVGSRDEDREVYAPGPFLDLALVSVRRAARVQGGGRSALLVGPAVPSVPHATDLADSAFGLAAGRLPDRRSAWLVRERGSEGSNLEEAAASLAKKLADRLQAPIHVSVIDGAAGVVDVDGWIERATRNLRGR